MRRMAVPFREGQLQQDKAISSIVSNGIWNPFFFPVLGPQRITWHWGSSYTLPATASISLRPYIFGLFDPNEGLGTVVASKSLYLQHLAISFMVDAEELFRRCRSTWS
ncbi:hypothetical protein GGS26DRAFT_422877 [Hypomontagnella submonticulosa]|nr:hypothetical protein GGS26DRAFT_422877 [Hypomontagnella submonticulosa]